MDSQLLNKELQDYTKPYCIESDSGFPLEKLNSRAFELLIYSIFIHKEKNESSYNHVELLSGVGERGRDCTLHYEEKVIATLQCKHSKSISKRYSLNEVGMEITKFILHYIQDPTLITELDDFTYWFVTNTDVNEAANTFFLTKTTMTDAFENYFPNWIKNNLKAYKKLTIKNDSQLKNQFKEILLRIRIKKIHGELLNIWINQLGPKIVKHFFGMRSVVDSSLLDNIENILNKHIQPKLDNVIKLQRNSRVKKSTYLEGLTKYLNSAYTYNSYVTTIVFGNNKQKLDDLYVPLTIVNLNDNTEYIINHNIKKLIQKNSKILISSTAGMGKSTIVKKIFVEVIRNQLCYPILIDLRRLNDKNSVIGEILKKLKPLVGKLDPKGFISMINEGDFLFVFDGFDEIEDSHKVNVVQKLVDFIQKSDQNRFIITSRPETALATFANFQNFKIKDLTLTESLQVLDRYGKNLPYAEELKSKIKGEDLSIISDFLKNPLLVSLLYKAYEYKRRIPYKKPLFYSQVYDALFENHDLTKEGFTREKKCKLDIKDFESVLRYLAYKSTILNKTEYLKDELEYLISLSQKYFGLSFSISNFRKDLLSSVPLFTSEGNYYNWSHKSLQDYFAAKFIQLDTKEKQRDIIKKIYNSKNCQKFENLLDILYDLDFGLFRNTIVYWLTSHYKTYTSETYKTFKNIPQDLVKKRKSLLYRQKVILINDYRKVEDLLSEKDSKLYSFKRVVKFKYIGGEGKMFQFQHFQYFFIQFLSSKSNDIIIKSNSENFPGSIHIEPYERVSEAISDSKNSWFNKDEYYFNKANKLLESMISLRPHHDRVLKIQESILSDIKIRNQDDLLQFE